MRGDSESTVERLVNPFDARKIFASLQVSFVCVFVPAPPCGLL
ncbi:hypothetical protein RE6C_00888 [Rhodopirellula europaea 6C]|uniref:Uncharacterized protein n=1 Tax=Rhodopirellula europaea 6C TaxID=1263867 RepID=M2B0D3_9BACT|nr:hypothetical protein RE6C_00888 [Rhodopirellula europaea 6C]